MKPDSKPPRILHLLAPAEFGGLETVVETLSIAQAHAGYEVHVALTLNADAVHPMRAALEAAGVRVHVIHVHARAYRKERQLVRDLIRNVRPSVVHTHGYRPALLHAGAVRRRRIALVATSHGWVGGTWKNRLYEHLERRAYSTYDAVVAVSEPLAAQMKAAGIPEGRVHLVPNAWTGDANFLSREDARLLLGIGQAEPCVGFVGRLGFEKGPDIFLDAVSHLNANVTAVIIGDGAMAPALKARASSVGATVRWMGAIGEAGRLMLAFDTFVLSSRTEGTPMVLLEAMAAEVPIVAARVGGVPNVLSQDEALLVQPQDPAALAAAIRESLADRAGALHRAGNARRKLSEDFNAGLWLDRYQKVYEAASLHPVSFVTTL